MISLPSIHEFFKKFNFSGPHTKILKRQVNNISTALGQFASVATLEKRSQALNNLLIECKKADDELAGLAANNKGDSSLNLAIVNIHKLQANAAYMLKTITNTWSNNELRNAQKAGLESQHQKKIAKDMENVSFEMADRLKRFDEHHNVIYHQDRDEAIREKDRVFLDNGKLMQLVYIGTGQDAKLTLKEFDTSRMGRLGTKGVCMFVISTDGKMYARAAELHKYHHSTFLAGEKVAFAGDLKVINGNIISFDNDSGHYQPSNLATIQLQKILSKLDTVDESTKVSVIDTQVWVKTRLATQKESLPYALPPNSVWKKESSGGTFARRYKEMREIDKALEDFQNHKKSRSPRDNVRALESILFAIEEQRKAHPNSKRANAVDKLEESVKVAAAYFETQLSKVEENKNNEDNSNIPLL